MSKNNAYDAASVKQGFACQSQLYESAMNLRKYLYLASSNSLDESIGTSSTASSATADGSNEILKNIEREKGVRDVILQVAPTTNVEISNAAKNDSSKTVTTITKDDFQSSILSGSSKVKEIPTEILHIAVADSGKGINFSARGTEYVAIFSNLIPAVEFSKCVPYFNIRFIQNVPSNESVSMPFLTLESFLGAARDTSAASKMSGIPSTAILKTDIAGSRLGNTVTGIELFQAPQTLIRPMINHDLAFKAQRGINVIDPMQPLASIESINFDVGALGQNFMTTQTKVDLSIILHDRSRMVEISPLISPSVYPTIRAEIEWGWAHPEASPFSNNAYAKFINSLRSKQIFCVNSSTFSNKDSTAISIKTQLTGLGEFTAANSSIYTGDYVSYELIRARMNQLFSIIDTKSKKAGDPTQQQFVGAYEQVVSLSDWETSDKWVLYEDYSAIIGLIEEIESGAGSAKALIDRYTDVITNIDKKKYITTSTSAIVPTNLVTILQDDLRDGLQSAEFEKSPYLAKVYGKAPDKESDAAPDLAKAAENFYKNVQSIIRSDAGDQSGATGETPGAPVIALGDAIFRLVSVPLGLAKLYDEIRVTTFDFNDHAGSMAATNIGAFPIMCSEMTSQLLTQKMNVQKALQRLIGMANNAANPAFGIKQALTLKKEEEDKLAESLTGEDNDASTAERKAAREKIQAAFEVALTKIYKERATLVADVSFEPKFTTPRVRVHTEVTPIKDGNTYKQVYNIFIYDDANSGYRKTNLLSAIAQQPSGVVRTITQSKDVLTSTGLIKAEPNADGTFSVSTDRAAAKRIISAAIPTLRIGTAGSMITNASYSTSAGGDIANLNLLKGIKNSGGASGAGTFPGIDADLFIIPTTLSLTMVGMPIINRGQTYYVDFGTGTTLDNTYTVTAVKHSIKQGSFTTSATLNITHQGSIKSVVSNIQTDLNSLVARSKANTPTTPAIPGPATGTFRGGRSPGRSLAGA
jgi:hypothetical protein